MAAYKELQNKAKALGIKSVGLSAEDLEKAIELAEGEPTSQNTPKDNPANTSIVFDGTREVRRYSLDVHGGNFVDLAHSFASKHKGYRVELKEVKPGRLCPKCGAFLESE